MGGQRASGFIYLVNLHSTSYSIASNTYMHTHIHIYTYAHTRLRISIRISVHRYHTSKEDCPRLINISFGLLEAMAYPLGTLDYNIHPQQTVMRTEDSRRMCSEVVVECIDSPCETAIRVNADAPERDLDCHEEIIENFPCGRNRRVNLGSVEGEERYGWLNAFIPRDGVTYVSTGSNSLATTPTLSQESVCYIQSCEHCKSEYPASSPRASGSFLGAAQGFDPDHVRLSGDPIPDHCDEANHGASSLTKQNRGNGRVRSHESGRSNRRSRFFNSATRRLYSLFPNKSTPELTPLNNDSAASPSPTDKPGFLERLACLGCSRR